MGHLFFAERGIVRDYFMIPVGGFQIQKPCHFVAMAFVVLNTRLNLRFRLAQNNKSQHNVLAFEPAEREGFEPPDL